MSRARNERLVLFEEDRFQLQVEEVVSRRIQTFMPNLTSSLGDFQLNTKNTPLQNATITLPKNLLSKLLSNQTGGTLRILNTALKKDSLFVFDRVTQLGQKIRNRTTSVGNLIMAATVIGAGATDDLTESQSVVIQYTLTEVRIYIQI